MGITIDGVDVTSVTIDGIDVTEITIDGVVVWTSGWTPNPSWSPSVYAWCDTFKTPSICNSKINYNSLTITQDAIDNCSSIDIELDDGFTKTFTSLSTSLYIGHSKSAIPDGDECSTDSECSFSNVYCSISITYNLNGGGTKTEFLDEYVSSS